MATRIPHQLIVHLDYTGGDDVEIRWSYPFSSPPIPEQLLRIPRADASSGLIENVDALRSSMIDRIPPVETLRVPHGFVEPTRTYGILTVVIQDQRRDMPVVRLYYKEIIGPAVASVEKQVRIDGRAAASTEDLCTWEAIHKAACKLAWDDFQSRFRPKPK